MSLNPTQPPPLPLDVVSIGRPRVLVTGAETPLGRAVVGELRASQIPSRAFVNAAASPAADSVIRGDVSTGAGLDRALPEVACVIHCASDRRHPELMDVRSTRNLIEAMRAWAPEAHLVLPSAIGVWESPDRYLRARADVENLAATWGEATSIIRTSVTHAEVASMLTGWRGRLRGSTDEISLAPVDPVWLARKIVDIAVMRGHLIMPEELAGPETLTLRELATLHDHLTRGSRRTSLALPTRSAAARALTSGSNLPSASAIRGGRTYSQWLGSQLQGR